MFHPLHGGGVRWCVQLLLIAGASAFGHEGHQPLPTKGVQIDLKAGHLTLSRAAREVLDVKSVEVQTRDVAGKSMTS